MGAAAPLGCPAGTSSTSSSRGSPRTGRGRGGIGRLGGNFDPSGGRGRDGSDGRRGSLESLKGLDHVGQLADNVFETGPLVGFVAAAEEGQVGKLGRAIGRNQSPRLLLVQIEGVHG
jgi:hypothetical protein